MKRRSYRFGEFRTSARLRDFKTVEGYLRRVYRENKTKIDAAFEGTTIDPKNYKKAFVETVKDELNMGNKQIKLNDGRVKWIPHENIQSALRSVGRSEAYLPEAEKFKENALKGIRSEGMYKDFREVALRDPKTGRYRAFDPAKMKYVGKGSYVYDGRIRIDYQNSPKGRKGSRVMFSFQGL
jgi:hypothetical protein